MIYLTYNDLPSGVYKSQVTDTCKFVNQYFNKDIKLITLISFRDFFKNKKIIHTYYQNSIVLPMFPKNKNWKLNVYVLKFFFLFIKKQTIWSRGIFATNIALILKKSGFCSKVIYDARGAYKAEFEEYLNKIVKINDNIYELELNAINDSDFKLAVSNKLVSYWRQNFNYTLNNHVVIPCTLNEVEKNEIFSYKHLESARLKLGFTLNDLILIYSGSSADWQSIYLLDDYLYEYFEKDENAKLILLSNGDVSSLKIANKHSNRIKKLWLSPNQVHEYLAISDYGILIREKSITNFVSSPTKFAEYLFAGLKVLISSDIGDYSEFTTNNNCGIVLNSPKDLRQLQKIKNEERIRLNALADDYFSKNKYFKEYKLLCDIE